MRTTKLLLVIGAGLLLISCDDGTGKAVDGGTGGRAGGGGHGGTGGQAGSTDAGGITCGATSPCGGDVAGTWKVTQSCMSGAEDLSSVCAGASADIVFSFNGTTTYNPNGTYTADVSGGGLTTYHYPSVCLPGGTTCDQFGQALMAIGMYSSVSCSTDASGVCNCAAMTASTATSETGTYATSGNTLTTMQGGITSMAPYCVQGNALYEFVAPGDGGATVTGQVVLTRQ